MKSKIGIISVFVAALVTGIFWLAPDSRLENGMVIVTAVPSGIDLINDDLGVDLSLIHISEPTRQDTRSRMPSSA